MKNIVTQKLAYAGHVRETVLVLMCYWFYTGSLKGRKQEADPEG